MSIGGDRLPCYRRPVATDPRLDLVLTPLGAEARPLADWLTTFHLATVVLDPYTNESSWILPTARRILEGLRGSDARVNFLVTADESDTRAFLGPLVDQFLVFVDPDRVRQGARPHPAAGVRVHPRRRHVPGAAEGWTRTSGGPSPTPSRAATAWSAPDIPLVGDPGPFHGSPAPSAAESADRR